VRSILRSILFRISRLVKGPVLRRFKYFSLAAALVLVLLPTTAQTWATDDPQLSQIIQQLADAAQRGDVKALAGFYHADGSTDDRLALANARRIISALALGTALTQHVSKDNGKSLVEQFGLIQHDLDLPMIAQVHDNGGTAVATGSGPDAPSAWYKEIDGVWKMDITPEKPVTVSQRTQDLEEDDDAIERITADVSAGKLKTLPQVRDALGNAMLNADSDGAFATNDMRLEGEPLPASGRVRPDPHGMFPTAPTTPAGAMNRFVKALQTGDEATLRDSLFIPEDHDGSCRAAAAHDYVVGLKLLAAAESRFPNRSDSNRVAFWLGVLIRDVMDGYTDDEWRIEPGYPDLAMSSWEEIPTTDTAANGKQVPVQESRGVPIMHHCADGHWRIGPRFPQNARQLRERAKELAAKDVILEQAAADLRAGKYPNDAAVVGAVMPRLQQLGSLWGLGGYSNSE
jgi:hypothetical protein